MISRGFRSWTKPDCYDYEAISRRKPKRGFTREMLQRLEECGESGDDEQAMILSAALDLGIEALEKGRIDARIDGGLFRGPRTGEGC